VPQCCRNISTTKERKKTLIIENPNYYSRWEEGRPRRRSRHTYISSIRD
jgi:hypothetical protein